jgi:chromosome segregation protein
MYGFKSFANKISIPFPEGFNCICGPNGVGKSNIIDALTFVLGTARAKHIRAEKLKNLIFNGSKNREASKYCEVSLYLDNSDKKIPVPEKEIKISRKVNRSGISLYKLNGRTVPKSKIIELLSYVNLSPEGHNIIMQGDVTRLIEMSNLERKEIIDDISGISEFDDKKDKAYRELEKVENRVRETMIVIVEKQRLVQRLKQERENALKYQRLEKELRKSKASLIHKKLVNTQKEMKELDDKISEMSKEFEAATKASEQLEKELEKKEKEVLGHEEEILEKSRDYKIAREIDLIKSEILTKKEKIEINDKNEERLETIISRLESIYEEKSPAVKEILSLNDPRVNGTISSIIRVPAKFNTAIEVALGGHKNDIVVSDDEFAAQCIKLLKRKRIGRARFIPLNKIKTKNRKDINLSNNVFGYAADIIRFDDKVRPAVEYALRNTVVVSDIDTARKLKGFRIVTLDGDLIELSGAMTGGFYRIRKKSTEINNYRKEIETIRKESKDLEKEIRDLEKKLKKLQKEEIKETEEFKKLREKRTKEQEELSELRKKRTEIQNKRMSIQSQISRLKINRAKLEAILDNLKIELEEYPDITTYFDENEEKLKEKVRNALIEINKLGPINMKAIEEYDIVNVEFNELKRKIDKLLEEKSAITKTVDEIEKKRYDKFMTTLNTISDNFSKIYRDLMKGYGKLRLEEENNIDSGLVIEASPKGKKILNIDAMSGGEKTLTSLAFLFAIMQYYSSPFYVLDEIDAALDKANTKKIIDLIKKYSNDVQFIVITHNDNTIAAADKVYGVSMENGVSKIFGIEMPTE